MQTTPGPLVCLRHFLVLRLLSGVLGWEPFPGGCMLLGSQQWSMVLWLELLGMSLIESEKIISPVLSNHCLCYQHHHHPGTHYQVLLPSTIIHHRHHHHHHHHYHQSLSSTLQARVTLLSFYRPFVQGSTIIIITTTLIIIITIIASTFIYHHQQCPEHLWTYLKPSVDKRWENKTRWIT